MLKVTLLMMVTSSEPPKPSPIAPPEMASPLSELTPPP